MGGDSAVQGVAPVPQIRRKRQRRLASQIERKHPCSFSGCKKSYGSEGALKLHVRRKHSSAQHTAYPRPLARAMPAPWPVCHSPATAAPSGTAYTPIAPDGGLSGLHSLDMAAHWEQQVALQLQSQQRQRQQQRQQQQQHDGTDQRHLQGPRAPSGWSYGQHQPGQVMPPVQHRPAGQHLCEPPASHAVQEPDTRQGGMYNHMSAAADGTSRDLFQNPSYPPSAEFLFCSPHYQHMAIASQLNKIRIGSWMQHLHPETGLIFSVDDIRRDLCYTVEFPQVLLRIVVGFESVASIKADTQMGETQITVQVKESPAFYKTDPSVLPATWTMTEDFTNGMATTFATHLMSISSVEFAEQLFSVLLSDNYFKDQSQNNGEEGALFEGEAAQHPKERSQRPLAPREPTRLHFTPIRPPVLQPVEAAAAIQPVRSLDQERLQRQLRQRQRRHHSQQGPTQQLEEGSPAASGHNQALQPSLGRGRVELLLNDCESILGHHVDESFEDGPTPAVLTNAGIEEEASSLYDATFDWTDTVDYANQLPIPQLR